MVATQLMLHMIAVSACPATNLTGILRTLPWTILGDEFVERVLCQVLDDPAVRLQDSIDGELTLRAIWGRSGGRLEAALGAICGRSGSARRRSEDDVSALRVLTWCRSGSRSEGTLGWI